MQFFTPVTVDSAPYPSPVVSHGSAILSLGSCFAQEVGERLQQRGFTAEVNPFGPLFNPISIACAIERIAQRRLIQPSELVENNGMWHSLDFHSRMSAASAREALEKMNGTICRLHDSLSKVETLILTFGSARAFCLKSSGQVVGNCHKLDSRLFEVRDLDIETIVAHTSVALNLLKALNPELKTVFTVSPIRHKAYGYHVDKLSKATLLLACHRLCSDFGAWYFPAYEIMMDELRDYRFYAEDMTHPSSQAIDFIFEKFFASAADSATHALAQEHYNAHRRSLHRPNYQTSSEK